MIALLSAGCSNATAATRTASSPTAAPRDEALKFATCMRTNGVREFPDPDASGTYTIDGIANRSSLDTDSAAFKRALGACQDLQPAGFVGHKRTAEEQANALKFAQCVRDNGVQDFPDPTPDAPLVDTNRIPSAAGKGGTSIPGLREAMEKCRDFAANAGVVGAR